MAVSARPAKMSLIIIFCLCVIIITVIFLRLVDPLPKNFSTQLSADSKAVYAGFAEETINLPKYDTWDDTNKDGIFQETEPFHDTNSNGRFDPLYLAGFGKPRPASGVSEPLKVSAMVLQFDDISLAVVTADTIGMFGDEANVIRDELGHDSPDILLIASTHTHSAPDTIGLWGENTFQRGVDEAFMTGLRGQLLSVLKKAINGKKLAKIRVGQNKNASKILQEDVRWPFVTDPRVLVLRAYSVDDGKPLGTLVNWAMHPEALERRNTKISSDFVHYLRRGITNGLGSNPGTLAPTVYINGAIGGLTTISDTFKITSIVDGQSFTEPSPSKIKAVGESIAYLAENALKSGVDISHAPIKMIHKSIDLPISNFGFKLMMFLGVLDRKLVGFGAEIRTEIFALEWGPISMLSVPGELYPEILLGGVETPGSGDFQGPPREDPPLIEAMPGRFKFTLGLTGGFLGYLIPHTQWDTEPPFLHDKDKPPYGEVVSLGPKAAERYYNEARAVLKGLKRL